MRSTSKSDPARLDDGQARRSLLMALVGSAAIIASLIYAPWSQSGPVLCPFRWLTGLPCPGCGLTRSFCAVAHGDLRGGFAFHLLGPALFLAVISGIPILFYEAFTRHRVAWWDRLFYSKPAAYVLGGALFAFHIARLLFEGYHGTLLTGLHNSILAKAWLAVFG